MEHTSDKIHTSTHLAIQFLNIGPLHKHAAFNFAGNYFNIKLKISKIINLYDY